MKKNVASTIVFNCVQLKMVEKRSEKRKHSSISKSGSGAVSKLQQQTLAQFASLRSVTLHSIAHFFLQKVRLQLTSSLQNAENSVLDGGFRVVHVHEKSAVDVLQVGWIQRGVELRSQNVEPHVEDLIGFQTDLRKKMTNYL